MRDLLRIDHDRVYAELLALDPATASDVARIIGNGSWAREHKCHECGSRTWHAVELGEEPDHESQTAVICRPCLIKALVALDADRNAADHARLGALFGA